MKGPNSLYSLGQRLGLAATAHTIKLAQLVKHVRGNEGTNSKLEREVHEAWDKLARAAIAFTLRFMVVCGAGSRKKAREVEQTLNENLTRLEDPSGKFTQIIESLSGSARTFATKMKELDARCQETGVDPYKLGKSAEAREPLYWLSRGAITFTMQLLVACSTTNQDAVRDKALETETALVAHLDNVPWYEGKS